MKHLIFSTILLSAAVASAGAAVNPAEFPQLELDTDYQVTAYKEFKGKILAPESGMMIEYGDCPIYLLDSEGQLGEMTERKFAGYINGRQAFQFPVSAATTYYVYTEFSMTGGTIRFSMNPKLAIQDTNPAQNDVLSISKNSFISVMFNQNVNIESATVSCNGHTEPAEIRLNASDLSILVRDVIAAWYDAGVITGGELLSVRLDGITNALGEAQSPIDLHFIAAPTPAKLLSAVLPEAITSYMPESSAMTKAVFTFSHPMAAEPEIELCYAPISDGLGYEYTEKLQATVSGKVITVDFAGKVRSSQEMAPSGNKFNTFDLRLFLLRDTDGQFVLSQSEGMLGSFHLQIPYVETERVDIVSQFTPEPGADLAGTDAISIYYTNASAVSYSGVTFTSDNEQITVNKDELTVTDLGNDDAELTVAIPAGWAERKNVTVSLADLSVNDGIDHSADFRAKYNGFTLLFSNPSEGAKQSALAAGSTITIDTNLKSGDTVSLTISNGEKTVYGPVEMTERYEGSFTHVMQHEVILYSGTIYTMEFATAAGEVETVRIHGSSMPFEFSPTHLVGISPAEGASLGSNASIRLEFDGLVKIERNADSADFAAATASENAEDGYDNAWTLSLGQISGNEVIISFTATDQDGLIVEGNAGIETQSHFRYVYKMESGILEIETSEAADAAIYDLQGRCLPHPVRGINIVNGRKILK